MRLRYDRLDRATARWIVAVLLLLTAGVSSVAAEDPAWRPGEPVGLDSIGGGELLWKSARGLVPLPALDSSVDLEIGGPLLHGRLTQRFLNPTDETIEVLFAFPLPEQAVLHLMELRIGERIIRAEIQEKQQAARTYVEARKSGRKAALVTQQRPNLFTTAAANINPGETVEVRLEYFEELNFDDGTFRLRFPLCVTPRHAAGNSGPSTQPGAGSPAPLVTIPIPTRPRVNLEIRLQPGMPVAKIESESHPLRILADGDGFVIRPEADRFPADRDFVMRWRPQLDLDPLPRVFVEDRDGSRYGLVLLMPPAERSATGLGLNTETLFVVDVSGSMDGPSILQAQEALLAALDRLRPDDRFNILKFNNASAPLFLQFESADDTSLAAARSWVRALEAGGGTAIHAALLAGLDLLRASRGSEAQRMIFLTDGAVGNESEVFRTIVERLGDARLHTIGIGRAPNTHLMQQMAAFGRGLCEFLASTGEAVNRIDRFITRLDRPVAADLELDWSGIDIAESFPEKLPDLYAGQPLSIYVRFDDATPVGQLELIGQTRNGEIRRSALITDAAPRASGISSRWARAKIDSILDTLHEGADSTEVQAQVTELALEYHLVSPYTSLVAVEDSRTALGPARPKRLNSALPRGGTPRPLRRILGGVLTLGGLLLLGWMRRCHAV